MAPIPEDEKKIPNEEKKHIHSPITLESVRQLNRPPTLDERTEYNVQMERRRLQSLVDYHNLVTSNRFIDCTVEELEDLITEAEVNTGMYRYLEMLIARRIM